MKNTKNSSKLKTLILAGILGTAMASQGAVVIDDTAGARLYSLGQTGSGNGQSSTASLNIGTKSNNGGWDVHAGFSFQMTGASAGSQLLSADFSVSATGGQGQSAYNIDLYANRVSSSAAFNNSDFEVFDSLIMEDFWVVNDGLGNFSLDGIGQANLHSYLQDNWVEDDYVFFTLKLDTAPSFASGDGAVDANTIFGSASDNDAQLTLTTAAPEPSTLGLLGIGGAILMASRRRKARA